MRAQPLILQLFIFSFSQLKKIEQEKKSLQEQLRQLDLNAGSSSSASSSGGVIRSSSVATESGDPVTATVPPPPPPSCTNREPGVTTLPRRKTLQFPSLNLSGHNTFSRIRQPRPSIQLPPEPDTSDPNKSSTNSGSLSGRKSMFPGKFRMPAMRPRRMSFRPRLELQARSTMTNASDRIGNHSPRVS